ncbi:MAG: class I SAM-dependent methyltransferase [Minisyncoccota bacterium]
MKKIKNSEQSFGKVYEKTIIDHIPPDHTEQQVIAIKHLLHLKPGARILDIGCGSGRHSIGLAKNGYKVTGIDTSASLLHLAQKDAKDMALSSHPIFLRKNILALKSSNDFDAAISIFSFGFSNHERDHVAFLKNTARALKKNGKVLLATVYFPQIIKILEEVEAVKRTTVFAHPDVMSLREGVLETKQRSFDLETMVHTVTTTLSRGKKIIEREESSVRVFTIPEVKQLFIASGLRVEGLFGDFDGGELTSRSKRLVIVAKK